MTSGIQNRDVYLFSVTEISKTEKGNKRTCVLHIHNVSAAFAGHAFSICSNLCLPSLSLCDLLFEKLVKRCI